MSIKPQETEIKHFLKANSNCIERSACSWQKEWRYFICFNMYLQQGGHRQKRLTTWWKLKQNQKKKEITFIINAVFPPFFPISNIFCLKKLYNIKKRTKKEPLILLHETFRIWNYPNMRYKAIPQGLTASYSILLCHQEEKCQTEKKTFYLLPTPNIPLLTLPTPECYSIIHQHNRNTEMINVTALLTGHKDREKFDCILYNSISNYRGGNTCSCTLFTFQTTSPTPF